MGNCNRERSDCDDGLSTTSLHLLVLTALGSTVTPLATIMNSLPPPSTTQALPKTRFSMYLPDHTPKWLQDAKVKSVLIVGIESHVCVLQTTLDLLENGYDVHILADGVSSCNAGERKVALEVSKRLRNI